MDRERVKTLVESGLSIRDLARVFEVSPSTVRYYLKKYSLSTSRIKGYACKCGETDPKEFYGKMKETCKACHNKQRGLYNRERKAEGVKLLGGKCVRCGYCKSNAALEFHHTDPTKKDPDYYGMRNRSLETWLEELKKCILLCANCHREEHDKSC